MVIIKKKLVLVFQCTKLIVLCYANEFLVYIFNGNYNIGP